MSLLTDAFEEFVMLDKSTVADGSGGTIPTWKEGATFRAAVTFDTSIEARIADKQGVTSLYTVTTEKNVILQYHEVIKRLRDGKILRITSDGDDKFTPADGDDKFTPAAAALNMRQVTAEEWKL